MSTLRRIRFSLLLSCCLACGSRVLGTLDGDAGGSSGSSGMAGNTEAGGAHEAGAQNRGGSLAASGAGAGGSESGQGNVAGGASGAPSTIGAGAGGAPVEGSAGAVGEGGAAGDAPSAEPAKALLLIDQRLYGLLSGKLEQYRALAEKRRGFAIDLRVEPGLDDRDAVDVKALLMSARAANPALEGVLFVGNVALPTFYKPRNDNLSTRLFPYFYEDLAATWMRAQDPGTTDPKCIELSTQPQQNCNVLADTLVPPHDYDRLTPGPNNGPELWSAYWPVGVSGGANDYATFAEQLSPYLDKLLAFYSGRITSNGRYYFASNDPGWQKLELLWNALPRTQIDFYGKVGPEGQTGSSCIVGAQNLCYVRWPLESYASFAAFKEAYQALPFLDEGWAEPSIYTAHMNAALYEMVEMNVPSSYDVSILDTPDSRALTKAGLIVALGGASVTGFAQPRANGTVDIPNVLPSDSVGVAYLYGKSQALAVLGDPTTRGHYANFPVVYSALKTGLVGYLGAAHRAQMRQNYLDSGYEQCVADSGSNCGYTLPESASEMLLGDPFMDLK